MKTIQQYLTENGEKIPGTSGTGKYVKCLISYDNKILVLRRSTGTKGEGNWDLPGGEIEENETPKQAIRREIEEETNLRVTKLKQLTNITIGHGKGIIRVNTTIFQAEPSGRRDVALLPTDNNTNFQNVPRPEHSEYRWIQFQDELERMPMIKDLLNVILKRLKKR